MDSPYNPDDVLRRFQNALQQTGFQYQNAQLEAQLQAQRQNLAQQQHQLQQQQMQLEALHQGMQIGALIRSRRIALNADPSALEQYCALPPGTLFSLESGNSSQVSVEHMLRIMQVLGLQISAYPRV